MGGGYNGKMKNKKILFLFTFLVASTLALSPMSSHRALAVGPKLGKIVPAKANVGENVSIRHGFSISRATGISFFLKNKDNSSGNIGPSSVGIFGTSFSVPNIPPETYDVYVTFPSGTSGPVEFTVLGSEPNQEQVKLTVNISGGGGKVESLDSEISCGEGAKKCSALYKKSSGGGTTVSLAVVASTGTDYIFVGWSGDCNGTSLCNITMDEDKNVTAKFEKVKPPKPEGYSLTIKVEGEGTVEGASTSSPGFTLICGAEVKIYECYNTDNLTSLSTVTLTPKSSSGSEFASWSGDCSGIRGCDVIVAGHKSVTATFRKLPPPPPGPETVTLTVASPANGKITGIGGINCGSTAVGVKQCRVENLKINAVVDLSAQPDSGAGYIFGKWSGDCKAVVGEDSCRLVMKEDKKVSAEFVKKESDTPTIYSITPDSGKQGKDLSVKITGENLKYARMFEFYKSGKIMARLFLPSISRSDSEVSFIIGKTFFNKLSPGDYDVRVTKIVGAGKGLSSSNSKKFTIEPSDVVRYTLEVEKRGNGEGTVSGRPAGIDCGRACQSKYDLNSEVLLTADFADGSTFAGWSGDCVDNPQVSASCIVTMSKDKKITALFEKVPVPVIESITPNPASVGSTAIIKGLALKNVSEIKFFTPLTKGQFSVSAFKKSPDGKSISFSVDEKFRGLKDVVYNVSVYDPFESYDSNQEDFTVLGEGGKYALTVILAGDGKGSVVYSLGPDLINCPSKCSANFASESFRLTAKAASGSTFYSWSGCTKVIDVFCDIEIKNGPKTVVARFKRLPPPKPIITRIAPNSFEVNSTPFSSVIAGGGLASAFDAEIFKDGQKIDSANSVVNASKYSDGRNVDVEIYTRLAVGSYQIRIVTGRSGTSEQRSNFLPFGVYKYEPPPPPPDQGQGCPYWANKQIPNCWPHDGVFWDSPSTKYVADGLTGIGYCNRTGGWRAGCGLKRVTNILKAKTAVPVVKTITPTPTETKAVEPVKSITPVKKTEIVPKGESVAEETTKIEVSAEASAQMEAETTTTDSAVAEETAVVVDSAETTQTSQTTQTESAAPATPVVSPAETKCKEGGGNWYGGYSYCEYPTCGTGYTWVIPSTGGVGSCKSNAVATQTTSSTGSTGTTGTSAGTSGATQTSTTGSTDSTGSTQTSSSATSPTPAESCTQSGGSWDYSANSCQAAGTTSSGTTGGSSSPDPATICVQYGGTWDASTGCRTSARSGPLFSDLFRSFKVTDLVGQLFFVVKNLFR